MSCENLYAWEERGRRARHKSAMADELISQNTAFFLFPEVFSLLFPDA